MRTMDPVLLKQTISSEISADIRSYMAASVTEGTSRTSKVQGYSSGGKTGTAEKLPRGNHKYLVSFITFAPVETPQIVLYVVVDEPNAEDQADSKFPQYIAQGILSELLPYLNIEPDEAEEGVVPQTELWEGFNGVLEDISGGSVDEAGNLVDAEGNLIDMEGNRVDEEGYLLNENGERKVNDNGEYIKSENMETFSGETLPASESGEPVGDAVSNPDAPEPPQSSEDPITGNNMESDGITNEEAGLE